MFLKISQNSHENTCAIKQETLAQVFSFEFCEIFKNDFFTEHLWTTASGDDLSQYHVTSPPVLSCDTSVCNNSSDQTEFVKESPDAISCQDDELLRILEDL